MKKEKKPADPRLSIVGGQAVLEGVMMKSGENVSLAVRGEDVYTEPFDPSKVEDPSLIIYAALREYENKGSEKSA